MVSTCLSGFVLGSTIFDAIKADRNKLLVLGVVCGVVLLHAGLAVGMKVNLSSVFIRCYVISFF